MAHPLPPLTGTTFLINIPSHLLVGNTYTIDWTHYKHLLCSMATSQKCHEGHCGPCFLCNGQSTKYSHQVRFKSEEYTFLCQYEDREIDATVCICYPCHKQIQRNIGIHDGRNTTLRLLCVVLRAVKRKPLKTHLASRDDIEHNLQ